METGAGADLGGRDVPQGGFLVEQRAALGDLEALLEVGPSALGALGYARVQVGPLHRTAGRPTQLLLRVTCPQLSTCEPQGSPAMVPQSFHLIGKPGP